MVSKQLPKILKGKMLSLVDLGLSVEQIATALKIDLKTIQKWIEQNPQS